MTLNIDRTLKLHVFIEIEFYEYYTNSRVNGADGKVDENHD